MKNKKKLIIVTLTMFFLLSGLTGCAQENESKPKEVLTFKDGIFMGISLSDPPNGAKKTAGFSWGLWIGRIWLILFCFGGGIWRSMNGHDYMVGFFGGYIVGYLTGALIYWAGYGVVSAVIWLIGGVGSFFQ